MRAFLDTNVLLNFLGERDPFYLSAAKLQRVMIYQVPLFQKEMYKTIGINMFLQLERK